jgi:hypothetical protein
MAAAGEGKGDLKSTVFDLAMNCYDAGLPLGACGEILMRIVPYALGLQPAIAS